MAVWGSSGHGDVVSTVMRTLVRYGLWWGVTVVSVCAWVHVFQVDEARHWSMRSRRGAPWPMVRSGGRERPEEGKKLTVGGVEDWMAMPCRCEAVQLRCGRAEPR